MAKAWEDYLPDVFLEAPGCPTAIAVNAIRSAAISLCQERNVWQEDIARIALVGGVAGAVIAVPADSEIATILDVLFYPVGQTTGVKVSGPHDERTLNTLRPEWKDEASTGTINTVDACAYVTPLVLRIIPKPVVSQPDAVAVTAALRPTRASTSGPDFLYTDYLETVTTGALAKLLAMGNKPWTDLTIAIDKRNLFAIAKTRAGIRRMTAGGTAPLSVYPRTLA